VGGTGEEREGQKGGQRKGREGEERREGRVASSECIASARWSCLAGVELIRPGLRYDGIKVLNVLRIRPLQYAPSVGCVQRCPARTGYSVR